MNGQGILQHCKYYKGEDKNPWDYPNVSGYNKLRGIFWEEERKYLNMVCSSSQDQSSDIELLTDFDLLQFVKGSKEYVSLITHILTSVNLRFAKNGFRELTAQSAKKLFLAYVKLAPLGDDEFRYFNFFLGEKENPWQNIRTEGIYYGLFWDWERSVYFDWLQSGRHLVGRRGENVWTSESQGIFGNMLIPVEIKELCLYIIGAIGMWDPYTGDDVYEAAYLKGITTMTALNKDQQKTLEDFRSLEDELLYFSTGGNTGCAPTRFTPEKIDKLADNEVFVFGSNKLGHHHAGAARAAMDKFDAQWGVGDGPTGKCYAISSMEGLLEMAKNVNRFVLYASEHPEQIFLVTPIGCGIAGYTPLQIAPLFMKAVVLPNVYLPKIFWEYIWQINGICPDSYQFDKRWKDWEK